MCACRTCGSRSKRANTKAVVAPQPQHLVNTPAPVTLDMGNEGSVNPYLLVQAVDQPNPVSNAHHQYTISYKPENAPGVKVHAINFQNGPLKEPGVGVNGITNEALLAIVIHRLECFESGKFACEENARALAHTRAALQVLEERTKERAARGVEGLHKE